MTAAAPAPRCRAHLLFTCLLACLLLSGCIAVPRDARAPAFDMRRPGLPLRVTLAAPDALRDTTATIPAQMAQVPIGERVIELSTALVHATFARADASAAVPGCYTLVPEVVGQAGAQEMLRPTRGTYLLALRWTLRDAAGRIVWVSTTKSEVRDVDVLGGGWLAWLTAYSDAATRDAVERARTTMLDSWSLRRLAEMNVEAAANDADAASGCGT